VTTTAEIQAHLSGGSWRVLEKLAMQMVSDAAAAC